MDNQVNELLNLIQTVDPGAEILAESATADVKEWIGTGSYILNAAISGSLFKGVPSGRVTVLSGESGCLPGHEIIRVYKMRESNINRESLVDELNFYHKLDDLKVDDLSDQELLNILLDHIETTLFKEIHIVDLFKDPNYSDTDCPIFIDTPDGPCLIGDKFVKPDNTIYKISTTDHQVECSAAHKVEVLDQATNKFNWVEARHLKTGSFISTKSGIQEVTDVAKHSYKRTVYDIEVLHSNHRYWAGSGISSHNCGKSFLMNGIARESQGLGYTPVIIDTENAIDNDFCRRIGVDTNNLIIKKCTTVSEMSNFVLGMCNKIEALDPADRPKIMFILDSLSNLSSDAEVENAETSNIHKQDFTKNKGLKAFFRTVTTKLGKLNIPMLISTHVYACLTEETKIKMADGSLKSVKDVQVGDSVISFDQWGEVEVPATVTDRFEYHEAKVMQIEFEDGYSIKCTVNHPLYRRQGCIFKFAKAEHLNVGDQIIISANGGKQYLKVKSIKVMEDLATVYDITVKDHHNFILENGVVSSNSIGAFFPTNQISGGSGLKYSASTILMLTAAKLDGENKENDAASKKTKADITKTGVRVTAKVDKSRFSIPTKVQFQIPFFKGMNPYVGLETFMTFENCGIARGSIVSESEYNKTKAKDKDDILPFEYDGKTMYFKPGDRARGMVVAHLGKQVPFNEFYTKEVFTDELLHKLDNEIIKPTFELPTHKSNLDIEEYIDASDSELDD